MEIPDAGGPHPRRHGVHRTRQYLPTTQPSALVGLLLHAPRAARRPASHIPNLVPGRPAPVFLPAESSQPRHVPGESRARRTHVSNRCDGDQRGPPPGGQIMRREAMRLFGIHVAGNAVVLGLAYYWLGIGESRAATLAWSAVLALVILCLACCLHGGTLAFFRAGESRSLSVAFRTVLRHMAPFLAAVILIAAVYWLLTQWAAYSATPALRIASWCTLKLRKPVKPATVLHAFDLVLALLRWMVTPVFILPMFSGIAARGWRGSSEFGRHRRNRFYWFAAPLLLLCALALPWQLVAWVPRVGSFTLEMLSFTARAA